MKKIKILFAFFTLFSAVTFVSCESEPVDPVLNENLGENPVGPSVFKVDFSGETHTAIQSSAKFEQGVLAIVGVMSATGEAVTMTIDDFAVKTYNEAFMGYLPGTATADGYLNLNPETGQNNGKVVITKVDKVNNTISGTFSFTGWRIDLEMNLSSLVFTNGVFENVPITGLPQNPGTGNQEFFKAKVNGVEKTFGTIMPMSTEGKLMLSAMNVASQETMSINMPENITAGTYSLEMFTDYFATYSSFEGASAASDAGTLKITSNTGGWIKGTFSFTGTNMDDNPMTITNGEFSVEY